MGIFNRSNETESATEPTNSQIPERKKGVIKDFPMGKNLEQEAGNYGIEDAIKLMRDLPEDNIEVVVTVVKKTLESADIQVSKIIGYAEKKEVSICERVKKLEAEITKFEESIAERKEKISALKEDLTETSKVKKHLELAEHANKQTSATKEPEEKKASQQVSEIKSAPKDEKTQENPPTQSAVGTGTS